MSYYFKQSWHKPKLIFSHILHRHVPQEEHDAAVASAQGEPDADTKGEGDDYDDTDGSD